MNQEHLKEKLTQQLELITFSLKSIDQLEIVALNIATNIRVLVHDKPKSTSLLKLLGIKEKLKYHDTSAPKYSIANWKSNSSISGWDMSVLPHIGIVGKDIKLLSNTECRIKYTPIYQDWTTKRRAIDFEPWWNTIIYDNHKGITLSRQQLILNAANKDGGAHIDNASEAYSRFSKLDVFPFTLNGIPKTTENIPVYACIAQIGWELIESIKDYPFSY